MLMLGKKCIQHPVIQGGMGIGYSTHVLASAVSREGGLGVISSAALDRVVSARIGKKVTAREAAMIEVQAAKINSNGAPIGMNIMVAQVNQYEDLVMGALDGGVDVIISGAGLPIKLPTIVNKHPRGSEVALIPIVSSLRALNIILRKWGQSPIAVVVEGPLAGGHIGWTDKEEALSDENKLENIVGQIIVEYPHIPVIAAGGIFNKNDILRFLRLGCSAVQMGTRFLATHESGASIEYKEELVRCTEKDIVLSERPGSPCKMLFRVIKNSPFYQEALAKLRIPKCDKGYVLYKGDCLAKKSSEYFCICNGLLASSEVNTSERPLYTVGARASEINEIVSVKELMQELLSKT